MVDSSPLDWPAFAPPATWKQNGREMRGPCPVTGDGTTKAWAVPDDNVLGCRACGDGSGRLSGSTFREHAAALGLLVDLGGSGGAWEHWTWTTADGRERRQFRTPDGKRWAKKDPPVGGWPKPRDLLYAPGGVPGGPGPVYANEGASDADAVRGLGLRAIGRTNAQPSAASLARLEKAAPVRVWPDVDDDRAGYRQAVSWADAATAAGLRVEVVDPLRLRPDAPSGYDARDWVRSLPDGTDAATAASLLDAAVVAVDAIRGRVPAMPAAPVAKWTPSASGLPIPRIRVGLCDSEEAVAIMVAELSAGRLRHDADAGEWWYFTMTGWASVMASVVEEHLADCARRNIGTQDKNGELQMRPAYGGRRSVGRAVAGLLAGRPEVATRSGDWDATRDVVLLPNGDALNARTGTRTPPAVSALYRRRVGVEPASGDALAGSQFWRVVQHVIPGAAEREYLQRRLGAALVDAEGLDDLLWLFGPPGCGKGTLVHALRETFGDLAGGVPIPELLRGGNKGHTAWLARLQGCRLLIADEVPVGRYVDDAAVNTLLGSVITATAYALPAVRFSDRRADRQHVECAPADHQYECASPAADPVRRARRRRRPEHPRRHVERRRDRRVLSLAAGRGSRLRRARLPGPGLLPRAGRRGRGVEPGRRVYGDVRAC